MSALFCELLLRHLRLNLLLKLLQIFQAAVKFLNNFFAFQFKSDKVMTTIPKLAGSWSFKNLALKGSSISQGSSD